ncbi:MAG TPA: YggT family protein [Anaerolineales bacterium]|nr:YggT family protein [Anaerolineales bacterium]
MFLVAEFIHVVAQVLMLLVIVSAVLSYFMSPYHPLRQAIDRVVDPLLGPIRRVVPTVGGFDFSPLILIILIGLIDQILTNIFLSL